MLGIEHLVDRGFNLRADGTVLQAEIEHGNRFLKLDYRRHERLFPFVEQYSAAPTLSARSAEGTVVLKDGCSSHLWPLSPISELLPEGFIAADRSANLEKWAVQTASYSSGLSRRPVGVGENL